MDYWWDPNTLLLRMVRWFTHLVSSSYLFRMIHWFICLVISHSPSTFLSKNTSWEGYNLLYQSRFLLLLSACTLQQFQVSQAMRPAITTHTCNLIWKNLWYYATLVSNKDVFIYKQSQWEIYSMDNCLLSPVLHTLSQLRHSYILIYHRPLT